MARGVTRASAASVHCVQASGHLDHPWPCFPKEGRMKETGLGLEGKNTLSEGLGLVSTGFAVCSMLSAFLALWIIPNHPGKG